MSPGIDSCKAGFPGSGVGLFLCEASTLNGMYGIFECPEIMLIYCWMELDPGAADLGVQHVLKMVFASWWVRLGPRGECSQANVCLLMDGARAQEVSGLMLTCRNVGWVLTWKTTAQCWS